MTEYLTKFKSSISQNQFNRLTKLLDTQRRQGQFKTIEDFRMRINDLMRDLFEKQLAPLLSLFEAIRVGTIDSETFNFMLDRIQDDLEVAFYETLTIDEIQRSHSAIVKDVILRNLKHALADLEEKVATHELVVASGEGFSKSLFSNFTGSSITRLQRDSTTTSYFSDPRTNSLVSSEYDSLMDQVGKFLVLPYQSTGYVQPVGIRQIFDTTAKASTEHVTPDGMVLENLIDNERFTYWAQLYLFPTDEAPTTVTTKLELDLGGAREIDFVEIEPALLYSVELSGITFIKGDDTFEELEGVSQTIEHHRAKIPFRKVAAKKLILEFTNENSAFVDYRVEEPVEGLNENLPAALVEDLNIEGTLTQKEFSGKQFQIGFDNIKVGLATFQDRGIYVSQPLKLSHPARIIGLRTEETRPGSEDGELTSISPQTSTYDADDDMVFFGNIEYWIILSSYDTNPEANLIATDIIPILPIGKERVNHERLVLTHKYSASATINDAGRLMFYTTDTEGDIKVYRNGQLLSLVTLETEDGWMKEDELSSAYPGGGKPMKYGVRITQPAAGDIYTVSYTPVVSNVQPTAGVDSTQEDASSTHHRVIDLVGDLSARSYDNQIILTSSLKSAVPVGYHELRLLVFFRRNTANENLSPSVYEYLLAVGEEDETKFEGLDE